ncbi:MAG: very short patch repair endonuclease [Acidobacteria bacterium]|nr:very short patch repair endonuclease [Acidobacteriota bacterium]
MPVNRTPCPSSASVSRRMHNTPRRDTPLEMQVRTRLHRRGLRFRVDRTIPGVTRSRPDLVFPKERIAVFLDGCFWHSCPQHGTTPHANRQWWVEKLRSNFERDRRHDHELTAAGWLTLRFWEHEEPAAVVDTIEQHVRSRRVRA